MDRKIDKRRHIYPTRCYSCREERNRDGSLLGKCLIDSGTFYFAFCSDCGKLGRLGKVLANTLTGELTQEDFSKHPETLDRLYKTIIQTITQNEELRGYLGIPKDKQINIDAIIREEDDLDQRVRDYQEQIELEKQQSSQ